MSNTQIQNGGRARGNARRHIGATVLRKWLTGVSDRRLARRRLALERNPGKAPRQTALLPSAAYVRALSTPACEKAARSAEMAGLFGAATVWWDAAINAETASLTQAVEAGQWPSQAAYERYAEVARQRIRAYEAHRNEAGAAADVIARRQAANA